MPTLSRISNFVERIQNQLDSLARYYDQENMRDRYAIADIKAIYKDCRSMISKVKVVLAERNLKRKREDCRYWQNVIINEKLKISRHEDEDSDATLVLEPCQPSTPESSPALPVTPRTQQRHHHPVLHAHTMSPHIHHSTPINRNCQESYLRPHSRHLVPFSLLNNFPELLHPQKKTKISNEAQVNLAVQKHTPVPRNTLATDLEDCSLSIVEAGQEENTVREENGEDLGESVTVPAKVITEEKNLKICHTQKEFISSKKAESLYEKTRRPLQQNSYSLLKEVKASESVLEALQNLQSVEGTFQEEQHEQNVLQLLVPATYSSRDPRLTVSSNNVINLYNYYKAFLETSLATETNAPKKTSQKTVNVNTMSPKRLTRLKTVMVK